MLPWEQLSSIVLMLVISVWSHPQCLDSLPPFERARPWCRDYPVESCCTHQHEVDLVFRDVIPVIRRALVADGSRFNASCLGDLWRLSCTRCSPWAQHMYEGVQQSGDVPLPSLCKTFCESFYSRCYSLLFDYFNLDANKYSRGTGGAVAFCRDHQANLPDYCYPEIITGPKFDDTFLTGNDGSNCLCGVTIASGLKNPLAAIPPGDGSGRLFIPEQRGRILVLSKDNGLLENPFLDIKPQVLSSGRRGDERGLLGMAFHPDYSENGRFFVSYNTQSSLSLHNFVSEYRVSPDNPNVADASSERVIFDISQPEGNHNGGQIFFKDGLLFIVLGDGGGAGDRHGIIGNGLDTNTLHGSILRVDVSNTSVPYTIPPDNPFANSSGGRAEIYAYGLRNPWRCSVDRGDANGVGKGRIFCGDVGQSRFEEIDIIEKGGNYGWRAYEGFECYDSGLCNDTRSANAIPPIHAYPHSVGRSVTGGHMYRGCQFPRLQGQYIYGDFSTRRLFSLKQAADGSWVNSDVCIGHETVCHGGFDTGSLDHILSFAEDEDGELYVLVSRTFSADEVTGSLVQLVDPSVRADPSTCTLTRKEPI